MLVLLLNYPSKKCRKCSEAEVGFEDFHWQPSWGAVPRYLYIWDSDDDDEKWNNDHYLNSKR